MRPELGVAFSNHYLINAEGTRLEPESREYTRHYGRDTIPAGVLENANAAAWRQSIPMSASLLRTADLQRLGFREDLNTPDVEFFIRLALQGARFIFVPEYLMEYRIHLGAVTSGGLWTEELVECLTPIEVKPEKEPQGGEALAGNHVPPLTADITFHAQQLAEKALKGFLTWHDQPFRKTHDLVEIGEQCVTLMPHWRI
jgi:hypothetical protein